VRLLVINDNHILELDGKYYAHNATFFGFVKYFIKQFDITISAPMKTIPSINNSVPIDAEFKYHQRPFYGSMLKYYLFYHTIKPSVSMYKMEVIKVRD
jgi:hypothetical protein